MYRSTNAGQTFVEVFDGAADSLNPLSGQGWYDNLLAVSPTDENFVIWGGVDLYRSINGAAALHQVQRLAVPVHHRRHVGARRPPLRRAAPGLQRRQQQDVLLRQRRRHLPRRRRDDRRQQRAVDDRRLGGAEQRIRRDAVLRRRRSSRHRAHHRRDAGQRHAAVQPGDTIGGGELDASVRRRRRVQRLRFHRRQLLLRRVRLPAVAPEQHRRCIASSDYIYAGSPTRDPTTGDRVHRGLRPRPEQPQSPAGRGAAAVAQQQREGGARRRGRVVKNSLGLNDKISAIAVAPGNSDIVYIGHNSGRVYKTIAGNAARPRCSRAGSPSTTTAATNRLPNRRITRLTVDPSNNNIVYATLGGFSGDNVYKSVDGGASWADITGPSGGAHGVARRAGARSRGAPDQQQLDLRRHRSGHLHQREWRRDLVAAARRPVERAGGRAVLHGHQPGGRDARPRHVHDIHRARDAGLQPPTNLYASEISGNTVTLRWTATGGRPAADRLRAHRRGEPG